MHDSPIHVLMTVDAVGGVWTYALELARALGSRNVNVSLAVMGPAPSAAQRQDAETVLNATLFEKPGRLEWMEEPWRDVAEAGEWLLQLKARTQPDVIHLNGYTHGALRWGVPVMIVGHSCVMSWWNAVHGDDPPPRWNHYRDAVARGLKSAALVVAPTAAMLAALQHHYGACRRARVIANGRSAASGFAVSKEPLVLTAGRLWDPAKNVEALCVVAPQIPWPIFVAGSVTSPAGGTEAADERVRCLGQLTSEEMASWMARASVYAAPARYEPFGLSALEAALARCALVLGDIRSLREVWGPAALYVPPDNRCALASALQRLIGDSEFRGLMSQRAFARANELNVERMATAYYDAYCDLQTTKRRTAAVSS
jgi:glycogen synthase